MIKIPNVEQIREWDRITIFKQGISSLELMERAAQAFVRIFIRDYKPCKIIAICGKGNNGADALAALRLLFEKGYTCQAIIIGENGKHTDEFQINRQRLPSEIPIRYAENFHDLNFSETDIILDAIFGSGLSRKPEGIYTQAIEAINQSRKKIISIDVPSGLLADDFTDWPVVHADQTITFQTPKISFLLPSGTECTGRVDVADIGLDEEFGKNFSSNYYLIEKKDVFGMIPSRPQASHKGVYGHTLIMAGSFGMMGAAVLAARSALRTGAGKVTAAIPSCGIEIFQSAVPEAMVLADSSEKNLSQLPDLKKFDAVGIGPGIGMSRETKTVLSRLLEHCNLPLVIDADALNILSESSALTTLLNSRHILTPHPGEFRRMAGEWRNDFDRLAKLKNYSSQTGAIVMLKGIFSSVALPDGKVYFNPTGNPYMATAGSGDVLTGMIASLLAQGLEPKVATLAGVYLHGLAGDIASGKRHPIIAGDIISAIPEAWFQAF